MSDKIQELKCILKNNGKENPFENKLLRMLIKALEQLQAKTDECKELKDLIKMCGLTDIFQEYTALKQQLEKSHDNYDRWIENTKEKLIKENIVISQQFNTVLDKILDRFAVNDNYGLMAGDMYDIASEAKTALDKIK